MRNPKAAGGFFKGVATLFVEHPAAMASWAHRGAPVAMPQAVQAGLPLRRT